MSIASEFESTIENVQNAYQGLANLGATIPQNKTIENISDCLDEVYDVLPKTEFQEGTSITLEGLKGKIDFDTDNGKKVVGKGDTEQNGEPTPSTPVAVECVTGEQSIVESGINEINVEYPTATAYGVTCTKNGDGTYTFNGTAERDLYLDICYFYLPAGTHKLVGCPSGGSWNNYIQYIRREDGQPFSINDSGSGGTGEVAENEGQLRLSIMIKSGYACSNLLFKPMVTRDTSLTYADYEPYHTPITYPISLGSNKFYSIGDYADELLYDVENDKVYKKANFGELQMTKDLPWNASTYDTAYQFYIREYNIDNFLLEKHRKYCNYFKYDGTDYKTAPIPSLTENDSTYAASNFMMVFKTDGTQGTTLNEWKSWLDSHSMWVVHRLATPTLTELTDTTLHQQVKNWYYSQSFTGTTILESNGDLPMIIKVRALKGE